MGFSDAAHPAKDAIITQRGGPIHQSNQEHTGGLHSSGPSAAPILEPRIPPPGFPKNMVY